MYQQMIMKATDCSAEQAPLVEAWMRLDYGTLDGLDPERFRREAKRGLSMVLAAPADSAVLAKSYGLTKRIDAAKEAGK